MQTSSGHSQRDRIASFLPRRLIGRLSLTSAGVAHEEFDAAVLVTDISGFTVLTHRLVEEGPAGVERLSGILNDLYGQLITRVEEHGGEMIAIVGDALISVFQDRDTRLRDAVGRAADCGLAIAQELDGHRFDTSTTLRIRAGVGSGTTVVVRVGDESRWEVAIAGDSVADAFIAQSLARRGTVAVSSDAWALLQSNARGAPIEAGYMSVESVVPSAPSESLVVPKVDDGQTLAGYLPEVVRTRMVGDSREWLPELRPATAIFVELTDIDGRRPDVARLQTAVAAIQCAIAHYEGSFDKLVFDDKGTVVTVLFGLPPSAHENDPTRALLCAMDIRERLNAASIPIRVGVATGRVFTGPIGRDERRQYCIVGHMMNLASRLMQSSDGDVVSCPATREATRMSVEVDALGPRKFKGIAEPVEVYRPVRQSAWERGTRKTFDRTAEREKIRELMDSAMAGDGGAVWIEGEAGQGKTNLISDMLTGREADAQPVLMLHGDAIERRRPYHAFQRTLSVLLLDGAAVTPDAVEALLVRVDEPPDLAPLLNPMLSLETPDTEMTKHLTGRPRADRAHALIASLLRPFARRGLVCVAEDLHEFDSASARLVIDLQRFLPSLGVLITTRPLAVVGTSEHAWLRENSTTMVLRGLEVGDVAALIADRLRATGVSPEATGLIMERADGNPLFVESLAQQLLRDGVIRQDDGTIVVSERGRSMSLSIPDSLHAVQRARVSRLPTRVELTLKAASVIGRAFDLEVLSSIHPGELGPAQLREDVDILRQHGLLDRAVNSNGQLTFDHQITRDVVYDLMLFEQRRQLHSRAARHYERAPEVRRHAPIMAHHYELAGQYDLALSMLERAAEEAMRSGAFRDAENFLLSCLRIVEAPRDSVPRQVNASTLDRARWHRMASQCEAVMGNMEEVGMHAQRALVLLGETDSDRALGLGALSVIEMAGQASERLLGTVPWERRVTPEVAYEMAHAYQGKWLWAFSKQKLPEMIHAAVRSCRTSELSEDPDTMATGYGGMAMLVSMAGQRRLTEHYVARCIDACERSADISRMLNPRVALAMLHVNNGDWHRAGQQIDIAQQLSEQLQDHTQWGYAQVLKIWVGIYQDQTRQTRNEVDLLADRGRRANNVQLIAWAKRIDGQLRLQAGAFADAVDIFEAVLPLARDNHDRPAELMGHCYLTFALTRCGRLEDARAGARSAIALIGRPTSHAVLLGISDLLTALQEMIELSDSRSTTDELEHMQNTVLSGLGRYASTFPIGRATYHRHRGAIAEKAGHRWRAQRDFRKGLRAAIAIGMPREERLLRQYFSRER